MTTRYEKLMGDMTPEKLAKIIDSSCGDICAYTGQCEGKDCVKGITTYLNQELPLTKEQKLKLLIDESKRSSLNCKPDTCDTCSLASKKNSTGQICLTYIATILQEVLDELKSEKL